MLLQDIRNYLIGKGLVEGSTGWPCYIMFMPDDQNLCVGLFESGGYPADTLGRENERLTFQTRVRGTRFEYPAAQAQWKAIFDALQDAQQGSLGTSPDPLAGYTFIQAMQQGPLSFNDSNGRPNLCSNWRVMRARE
jgi:hypothetical protein